MKNEVMNVANEPITREELASFLSIITMPTNNIADLLVEKLVPVFQKFEKSTSVLSSRLEEANNKIAELTNIVEKLSIRNECNSTFGDINDLANTSIWTKNIMDAVNRKTVEYKKGRANILLHEVYVAMLKDGYDIEKLHKEYMNTPYYKLKPSKICMIASTKNLRDSFEKNFNFLFGGSNMYKLNHTYPSWERTSVPNEIKQIISKYPNGGTYNAKAYYAFRDMSEILGSTVKSYADKYAFQNGYKRVSTSYYISKDPYMKKLLKNVVINAIHNGEV